MQPVCFRCAETNHSQKVALSIRPSVPGHPFPTTRLPCLTKHQTASETCDDSQRLNAVLCNGFHVATVAIILGRGLRVAS